MFRFLKKGASLLTACILILNSSLVPVYAKSAQTFKGDSEQIIGEFAFTVSEDLEVNEYDDELEFTIKGQSYPILNVRYEKDGIIYDEEDFYSDTNIEYLMEDQEENADARKFSGETYGTKTVDGNKFVMMELDYKNSKNKSLRSEIYILPGNKGYAVITVIKTKNTLTGYGINKVLSSFEISNKKVVEKDVKVSEDTLQLEDILESPEEYLEKDVEVIGVFPQSIFGYEDNEPMLYMLTEDGTDMIRLRGTLPEDGDCKVMARGTITYENKELCLILDDYDVIEYYTVEGEEPLDQEQPASEDVYYDESLYEYGY